MTLWALVGLYGGIYRNIQHSQTPGIVGSLPAISVMSGLHVCAFLFNVRNLILDPDEVY